MTVDSHTTDGARPLLRRRLAVVGGSLCAAGVVAALSLAVTPTPATANVPPRTEIRADGRGLAQGSVNGITWEIDARSEGDEVCVSVSDESGGGEMCTGQDELGDRGELPLLVVEIRGGARRALVAAAVAPAGTDSVTITRRGSADRRLTTPTRFSTSGRSVDLFVVDYSGSDWRPMEARAHS